jgi:hypothetical protein
VPVSYTVRTQLHIYIATKPPTLNIMGLCHLLKVSHQVPVKWGSNSQPWSCEAYTLHGELCQHPLLQGKSMSYKDKFGDFQGQMFSSFIAAPTHMYRSTGIDARHQTVEAWPRD